MSSTNRGSKRNRDDYYLTPGWCVREFFRNWKEFETLTPNSRILDPSSGGLIENGVVIEEATYPKILREYGLNCLNVDVREDSCANLKQSYLDIKFPPTNDLIITNPPYNLAEQFIRKALTEVKEDGLVVMLLRLNFLGSQKRASFFSEYMPHSVYIHSKRPSFTNKGTDSTEYAHFVWQRGFRPDCYQGYVIGHIKEFENV